MPHQNDDCADRGPGHPKPEPARGAATALNGYEAIVCVCGGIPAYKAATIVSRLVQDGCGVTVAMTRNARRFVGPMTFQALTRRPILASLWQARDARQFQHLEPSEAADLIIVAPATANIIGKLAGGIADDLVSTLLLGADCPVMLAPAMNTRMWQHPAVRQNVAFLQDHGFLLVGPESGWLACGDAGPGRMSEPDAILAAIREQLRCKQPKASAT